VKVALDHHYSPAIAEHLRHLEFDVIAVAERDWQAEDDESLLALCAGEGRALLTNNVADFAALARRWHGEGRSHSGLIFTSDSSLPRTKDMIGVYVTTIQTLMMEHSSTEEFDDRIQWLSRTGD
jgi:hypothetical protein